MTYIFTFAFLFSWTVYGGQPECPQQINTKQTLKNKISPWLEFRTDEATELQAVEFYEGNPFKKVHLAPDNADKGGTEAVWSFQKSQEIWQLCRYTHTTVTLTKQMPTGLKTCTVKQDPNARPSITDVTCK